MQINMEDNDLNVQQYPRFLLITFVNVFAGTKQKDTISAKYSEMVTSLQLELALRRSSTLEQMVRGV